MQIKTSPRFRFYVGQPPAAICDSDAQWRQPLPKDRRGTANINLTHQDYFTAVADFLTRERMALLYDIAALDRPEAVYSDPIDRVDVHLVKHGAFYHPARVTFGLNGCVHAFVLNVVAGPVGRLQLPLEVSSLQSLRRKYSEHYVPAVYGWGAGRSAGGDTLPMFAGQWFDGYHELHISQDAATNTRQWLVWDADCGPWPLTRRDTASFFRQAVFILTRYFDPHTLGAIMEWHHAAGDFVVKKVPNGVDVRLITVRRYDPIFVMPDKDGTQGVERLLEALVVFWVKTSLWMRLDRLNGVGELVWDDGDFVAPMWEGFVQGLAQMAASNDLPSEWVSAVQAYLAGYTTADFIELGTAIIGTYPADVPEILLIKTHLEQHSEQMAAATAVI